LIAIKCPKCGTTLVKTLPDQKIITLDNNVAIAVPILYFEYDMKKGKVLRKAFMCPVCGHKIVEG